MWTLFPINTQVKTHEKVVFKVGSKTHNALMIPRAVLSYFFWIKVFVSVSMSQWVKHGSTTTFQTLKSDKKNCSRIHRIFFQRLLSFRSPQNWEWSPNLNPVWKASLYYISLSVALGIGISISSNNKSYLDLKISSKRRAFSSISKEAASVIDRQLGY